MAQRLQKKIYMKKITFLVLSLFLALGAYCQENYKCITSAKKYEKIYGLPENLLVSVALTESGRKTNNGNFVAWPWTINVKGKGRFFNSKQEAVNYVSKFVKKGKKNFDVGCMQVNHMYHPNAFSNLDKAFDPEINVEWSANLIKNLYEKYGSYREAVGYYHSYRPIRKNQYASKVFNTWRRLNKNDVYASIEASTKDQLNKKIYTNKKDTIANVSYQEKNNLKKTNVEEKLKIYKVRNNTKVNSAYIIARMEKVKFFRNYFLK